VIDRWAVRIKTTPAGLCAQRLGGPAAGFEAAVSRYFDSQRDYAALEGQVRLDGELRVLAGSLSGIRILRQPAFETIIAFIVSANNNMGRISRSLEKLAEAAGAAVGPLRAFPNAAALASIPVAELRALGLGYRDRYVHEAAVMVASGDTQCESLGTLPTPDLRRALLRIPGVGPKVADCIALFAFGRLEVFPVDTWVRRAYAELYPGRRTDLEIAEDASRRFGAAAGLAQQYLFEARRRAR
jgi:N-glycosylase/DNA lyase